MTRSKMRNTLWLAVMLPLMSGAVVAQETLRDITNQTVTARQLEDAVASRVLTWLTGSSSNNDYISVGRSANFFGFVALRVSGNHALSRSDVARDTLSVLSGQQRADLIALLEQQRAPFSATQDARFAMNRALEGLLVGEPITMEAFLSLGQAYGAAEAELGRVIAQGLGDVITTLSDAQRVALADIRSAHVSGTRVAPLGKPPRLDLPQEDKQELVNLAARLLSWVTGTPALNDFEVVGKPSQHFGFVSLRLESNHGVRRGAVAGEVLDLLQADQRAVLRAAAIRDAARFGDFLEARARLMRVLETAMDGATLDPAHIPALGAKIGEIEARMTWSQATAMLAIRDSLSDAQSSELLALRARYTASTLPDDPVARGRQLYAQCALCHAARGAAPDLAGILGRPIATDTGFDHYSPALRAFAQTHDHWTAPLLDTFLAAPRRMVPGTAMGFDGFSDAADRAAIIAYLAELETRALP
ncbi:MAG: c-type cytochrome [Pseudomonadota bacterium]